MIPAGSASLGLGEIHIWKADVDADGHALAPLADLLAPDEIDRASRFYFERERTRFVARRGLLRALLGRYAERPPASLQLVTTAFGKPMLSEAQGTPVRFNVSHSDSVIVLAFALARDIGIDIERVRHIPDCLALAERFLTSADLDALRGLDGLEQSRAFLSRWTACEAMAKARGIGLPRYLDERDQNGDRSSWSLTAFDAGEDMVGSVASGRHEPRVLIRMHQWH